MPAGRMSDEFDILIQDLERLRASQRKLDMPTRCTPPCLKNWYLHSRPSTAFAYLMTTLSL